MANLPAALGTAISQTFGAALAAGQDANGRYFAFTKHVPVPASLATDLGIVAANWDIKVSVEALSVDRVINVSLKLRKV
jgi:hypothetical protein